VVILYPSPTGSAMRIVIFDGLAVLCFTPKQVFGSRIISTDLDKILHTAIVVRNTLVGRLINQSIMIFRVA